ncbi:MAG: calcium/sodium antiporter [Bacteroidales bacterium]
MITDYALLLFGLVLLAFSGDWLVRGGSSLAKRFHVSPLVIGVTIISLGTSAPELVVSLNAALSGHPDISIGNVVGSNIANIALVLGLTALLISIPVSRKTIRMDWVVMMVATVLFFLFSLDGILQFYEGLIFVILLITYVLYSVRSSHAEMKGKIKQPSPYGTWLSFVIVLVSIGGLILGSNMLVNSASNIAIGWGVSERVISLSVIAFGTSVPELATSVMAAIRKELDISVGNLIGSNIFNIFGILGVTSLVTDIPVNEDVLKFDWFWMVGICLLLLVFMLPVKRARIRWWEGMIFLLVYFAYYYIIYFIPELLIETPILSCCL